MEGLAQALLVRLGRALLTVWLVVTAVFVVLRSTGDPVRLLLPEDAPIEQVEAMRAKLGLDRSIPEQYLRFWMQALSGDLGASIRFQLPALRLVLVRLWPTVQLGFTAFALAAVGGVALGILAALARGRPVDQLVMAWMTLLQASPSFLIGIVLIFVFSVRLSWFPSNGYGSIQHLVLPALTLAMITMAALGRIVRSSLLEVLQADYVRTARAKGLPRRSVVLRHALRSASLPIVTVLGLEMASLLTGAIVVETVFTWPGVGRLAVEAVAVRDYPVVQAGVLVVTLVFVTINFVVDVSYVILDPRVRHV
uniref:ABC transporter permease n=1 Tax=Thermorudis peleae TaxID=1382356 RepID=A0A831TFR2_9BACT